VVLFFLSVIFVNLATAIQIPFFRQHEWPPKYRRLLWVSASTLPYILPIILFMKHYTLSTLENAYLWGVVGITSFVVYGQFHANMKSKSVSTRYGGRHFAESGMYNTFEILVNLGLKLPILIFTYFYLFESMYKSYSFVILVLLITISGVGLMSLGRTGFIRVGLVVGLGVSISLVILSIWNSGAQILQFKNLISAPSEPVVTIEPWVITLLGIVLSSIWIGDVGNHRDLTAKNSSHGVNSKILSLGAMALAGFYFFSIIMSQGFYVTNTNNAINYQFKFNGFLFIIISGVCMFGLMSVFWSTSHVVASHIFKIKYRETTTDGVLILVRRLTIALSTVIALLLTWLSPFINYSILKILLTICIGFSIPVLAVFLNSIIEPNRSIKSINFSLSWGWLSEILIARILFSGTAYQDHLMQFFSISLLYNCLSVYLICLIDRKSYVSGVTNKILRRYSRTKNLSIKQ